MNPYLFKRLHTRLGSPAWFWPAVLFTIFIALPCLASALDGALQ